MFSGYNINSDLISLPGRGSVGQSDGCFLWVDWVEFYPKSQNLKLWTLSMNFCISVACALGKIPASGSEVSQRGYEPEHEQFCEFDFLTHSPFSSYHLMAFLYFSFAFE